MWRVCYDIVMLMKSLLFRASHSSVIAKTIDYIVFGNRHWLESQWPVPKSGILVLTEVSDPYLDLNLHPLELGASSVSVYCPKQLSFHLIKQFCTKIFIHFNDMCSKYCFVTTTINYIWCLSSTVVTTNSIIICSYVQSVN